MKTPFLFLWKLSIKTRSSPASFPPVTIKINGLLCIPAEILQVCSFEFIQIRISDPRSPESWCFKKTTKSHLNTDSSVPGAHYQSEPLTHLVIRVILHHKSWCGSAQRNAPYHSAALKPRELHSNSIVLIVGELWSYAVFYWQIP